MCELIGHTQEEEPVQDCDCKRCAIAERDRLRSAFADIASGELGINLCIKVAKSMLTPNSVLDRVLYFQVKDGILSIPACQLLRLATYFPAQ